jgi:hypothetical protein
MTEEINVTENEELAGDNNNNIADGLDPYAVELPFIAPLVEEGYPTNTQCASVNHFKIRLMAAQHYERSCTAKLQPHMATNPVRLFVNVPDSNHGFGSFIVAHLDDNQCVYSMEYVSCDSVHGMKTVVLVPSRARMAVSAEWGVIAEQYKDTSQLQRWARAILELNLVRDYKNTMLFDLLALVPPQR